MSAELYLTPKMGLIPEVSTQNYGSLAKALREYVSNAVDAGAKNVWLTFSADGTGTSILDIRDSGAGMTLKGLRQEFLAVGGSRKYDDGGTIGRIGIGFLAIVPLCKVIKIYTKASGAARAIEATIRTETMLPEGVRFAEIAKTRIGEARSLSAKETKGLAKLYGDSFTVFSLQELRGDVENTFADAGQFDDFREELRRILPLPWPTSGPLKKMVSAELWSLMQKAAGAHAATVYLNGKKLTRRVYGENKTRENCLYVREYRNEVVMTPDSDVGQEAPIRVVGFLVCDEPSNQPRKGFKMSGITTRVLNVAVDEDTFFGLDGREERKKRVAGEVFISGLDANKAIQINRNAFTETHRPVQVFRSIMSNQVLTFFSGMNRVWRAKSVINKEIRRIRNVVGGVSEALTAIQSTGDLPKRGRVPKLAQHRQRRAFSIERAARIPDGLSVESDKDIAPDGKIPYRIELSGDPDKELQGVIHVSRDLLSISRQKFGIGGAEFKLSVVAATQTDPPCAIDLRNKVVVLNEEHPLVAVGEKSVVEILVLLAYATEMADSPQALARQLVELLTVSRVGA